MDVHKLFSLENKRGFITGAGQGIGKTIARAFVQSGADVAVVGRTDDKLRATAKEIADETGRSVIPYQCDVSDPNSVNKMIAQYEKDFGIIDFAVNNAGIFTGEAAIDISSEKFKSVFDVNVHGAFFTAQAAARLMIKNNTKGSIINTASMSAQVINIPQTIASYCASKVF